MNQDEIKFLQTKIDEVRKKYDTKYICAIEGSEHPMFWEFYRIDVNYLLQEIDRLKEEIKNDTR